MKGANATAPDGRVGLERAARCVPEQGPLLHHVPTSSTLVATLAGDAVARSMVRCQMKEPVEGAIDIRLEAIDETEHEVGVITCVALEHRVDHQIGELRESRVPAVDE